MSKADDSDGGKDDDGYGDYDCADDCYDDGDDGADDHKHHHHNYHHSHHHHHQFMMIIRSKTILTCMLTDLSGKESSFNIEIQEICSSVHEVGTWCKLSQCIDVNIFTNTNNDDYNTFGHQLLNCIC